MARGKPAARMALTSGLVVGLARDVEHEPVPPRPAPIELPAPAAHTDAGVIGGCIMGVDPSRSVTNTYGQVWDTPNVFVTGAPFGRRTRARTDRHGRRSHLPDR